MDDRSQHFLNQYLRTLSDIERANHTSFSSDYFCADALNANLCADLIQRGEKRASCSLEHWYSHKNEPRPQIGHLQVVTDWFGEPKCIIEIQSVESCPFNQVTEEFAALEGEGDKTFAWWREAHWAFFSKECAELGIEMREDAMLVLERFHVVYCA